MKTKLALALPFFAALLLAACQQEKTCPSGEALCAGACAAVKTDARNCGGCGIACGAGETCTAGACACLAGYTSCGASGTCANLQTDPKNCGQCGHPCSGTDVCSGGQCAPNCGAGETNCGGTCANLQGDVANCGACGRVCGSNEACKAGLCVADLYVACFNTNEVREATATLDAAGTPLATNAGPDSLAWNASDLYVANDLAATLTVLHFDGRAADRVNLLSPSSGADVPFARSHGGLVFVANAADGTLVVVSPTGGVVDEVPLAAQPGQYVDPTGFDFAGDKAYVALHGSTDPAVGQEVVVVDVSGEATCTPPNPSAPACGTGNTCAAGTTCVNGLCQRPPCGTIVTRVGVQSTADTAGLAQPNHVLVVNGKAYVTISNLKADYSAAGDGKLAIVDTGSNALTGSVDLGAKCQSASSLALSGTTLFVTCSYTGSVVPVDLSAATPAGGTAIDTTASGVNSPSAITFCNGKGYVGDYSSKVLRFDPAAGVELAKDVCPKNTTTGYAYSADIACGP